MTIELFLDCGVDSWADKPFIQCNEYCDLICMLLNVRPSITESSQPKTQVSKLCKGQTSFGHLLAFASQPLIVARRVK